MARKWFAFFVTVECFLKRFYNKQKKFRRYLLILFLIGFLFTYEISPVFSQTPQSVVQIVREGKDFYDKGQYRIAIEKLEKAVNSFAESGDTLNQAVTLSNLSLAYQELGEWSEAEKIINQSLQIIELANLMMFSEVAKAMLLIC